MVLEVLSSGKKQKDMSLLREEVLLKLGEGE